MLIRWVLLACGTCLRLQPSALHAVCACKPKYRYGGRRTSAAGEPLVSDGDAVGGAPQGTQLPPQACLLHIRPMLAAACVPNSFAAMLQRLASPSHARPPLQADIGLF